MAERIIRFPELLHITGVSRPTIYRWIEEQRIPKPIKIGGDAGRAVGWRSSEISDWVEARFAESQG